MQQSAGSLKDFYRSLQMRVEISSATPVTRPRIAQLTQKTNQFNLTTRRYTEQELAALVSEPGVSVLCARVTDRFGDNGTVGVAITRTKLDRCEIDTFLLSCRAIGRTIETAFLAWLAAQCINPERDTLSVSTCPLRKTPRLRTSIPSTGFRLSRSTQVALSGNWI